MQGLLEENEPTPKSSGGMRQTMKSPNRSLTGNLNASTSNKAKDFGNKTPQKGIGRASTAKVHQQQHHQPHEIEDEVQVSP